MQRPLVLLALLAALSACGDGQPFFEDPDDVTDTDGDGIPDDQDDDDDGDGIPDDEDDALPPGGGFSDTGGVGAIPTEIAGNLTRVAYNPGDDTLSVTLESLDTTPISATYTRNAALDLPGYQAYSVQEDALDRMFVALVATAPDGTSMGGVVADGGQFNRVFGGAFYRRIGDYSPHVPSQPGGGLVSYAGTYAGLSNINAPRPGEILPVPGGTDDSLIPGQPGRVSGEVFLNADFADNTVNGAIYNREMPEIGLALDDVILVVTDIQGNGRFQGEAEDPTQQAIGDYGGAFGGIGATSVAGAVHIEDYLESVDNEIEWGTFVLGQCGAPGGAGAICDLVDPDAP